MTTTQTSAQLLRSLAAQLRDAETTESFSDLYLLARGVFYSELDALSNAHDESRDFFTDPTVDELRSAWDSVLSVEAPPAGPVVGFVVFSDDTFYGGAK